MFPAPDQNIMPAPAHMLSSDLPVKKTRATGTIKRVFIMQLTVN
jgi:hypothetical protein